MKIHKIYLLLGFFFLLLISSLIKNDTNFNSNEKNEESNYKSFDDDLLSDLDIFPSLAKNAIEYKWNDTWGNSEYNIGRDVAVDSLGNVYVVGSVRNQTVFTWKDICILKYNSSGDLEWSIVWGGSHIDIARGVAIDSNDDIYITGYTHSFGGAGSNVLLLKFNKTGQYQWARTRDYGNYDYGYDLVLDNLDNIYIAGSSYIGGRDKITLIKYNSTGDFKWFSTWNNVDDDYGRAIALDSFNNIYITGYTDMIPTSPQVNHDVCLIKFNSTGHHQWNTTWSGGGDDQGWDVVVDSFDNVYVTGRMGQPNMFLLKYNNLGSQIWSRTWGTSNSEEAFSIAMDSLGYIYIFGYRAMSGLPAREFCLLKYNSSGDLRWDESRGRLYDDWGEGMAIDSSDDIYLVGYSDKLSGIGYDVMIMKYHSIPDILVYSPSNNQIFNHSSPQYNVSIIGSKLNKTWYCLNNGQNHTFNGSVGKINQTDWDNCLNGSVSIKFYANNSDGELSIQIVNIWKDIEAPDISIISPSSFQLFGNNTPFFELSIIDANLDKTWYSLNGSTNYTFSALTGKINKTEWNKFESGNISIRFYANDTLGNLNFKEVIVMKNTSFPNITIVSPKSLEIFGKDSLDFELNIVEYNLNTTWYNLNDGFNYTFSGFSGEINKTGWISCDDGNVTIKFYANNTAGNMVFEEITVVKDTKNPNITIILPKEFDFFGNNTFEFELNIDEPNLNTTWYSLNGGLNYTFAETDKYINITAWEKCGNGSVLIVFYANDSLGHLGKNNVTVFKDKYVPTINIITPTSMKMFGVDAPYYEIDIDSSNIDKVWYSLISGPYNSINKSIEILQGKINQTLWENCYDSSVTIRFFVNNTAGTIGAYDRIVLKDTLAPNITILSPNQNMYVGREAPDYIVRINGSDLNYTWYKFGFWFGETWFDYGFPKFFFTTNDTINQTSWEIIWDTLSHEDPIPITFFANDTLANEGWITLFLKKYSPPPINGGGGGSGGGSGGNDNDDEAIIHGYDLILFLLPLIGISIIIGWKKFKMNKI